MVVDLLLEIMLKQEEYIFRLETMLEKQLEEVIAVFQNLPESVLNQKPAPQAWSITGCFDHLNSYAEYYHPKIKRGLENQKESNTTVFFRNTWLGLYFIKAMGIDRQKKKYKAIKQHRPRNTLKPALVISTFIQHLEDLQVLLGNAGTRDLKSIKIKTSLAPLIRINAGDAFEFLLVHTERHLKQARQNLNVV